MPVSSISSIVLTSNSCTCLELIRDISRGKGTSVHGRGGSLFILEYDFAIHKIKQYNLKKVLHNLDAVEKKMI